MLLCVLTSCSMSTSQVFMYLSVVQEVYVHSKQTSHWERNGLILTLFLHGQFLRQFLCDVAPGEQSRKKKQSFPEQSFKRSTGNPEQSGEAI